MLLHIVKKLIAIDVAYALRKIVPAAVLFQLGPLSHFFRLSPQCSDYEMWIYYVLIFIVIGRERWVSGRYDESGSRCHQFYNVSNTLWGATARDGPRRRDTKRICLLWWGQCRYVQLLTLGASQHQKGKKRPGLIQPAPLTFSDSVLFFVTFPNSLEWLHEKWYLSGLATPILISLINGILSKNVIWNGLIVAKSRLEK